MGGREVGKLAGSVWCVARVGLEVARPLACCGQAGDTLLSLIVTFLSAAGGPGSPGAVPSVLCTLVPLPPSLPPSSCSAPSPARPQPKVNTNCRSFPHYKPTRN